MTSTTSSLNQSSPVSKTAFDSIQAKKSALSVGYDSMAVKNSEIYNKMLVKVTAGLKTKRQTPLVNAGYACRSQAISHSIHAFISYHQHINPSKRIQIVLVGCGVDILGLWARSLVTKSDIIRVIELDVPRVCLIKKEFLEKHSLVEFENSKSEVCKQYAGTIHGDFVVDQSEFDYVLLPVDLKEISVLEQHLESGAFFNPLTSPTLVISELVLSYLDPATTNQLLRWCSKRLVRSSGSALLALEPLGFDYEGRNKGMSVSAGYRREYCHRFHSKMGRGKSTIFSKKADESSSDPSIDFYSIGTSLTGIVERFQGAGFNKVHVCDLGSATAHAVTGSHFRIPETFDEHAALILHLQSYTVITAFSSAVDGAGTLSRMMCPANYAASEIPPEIGKNGILYSTIELNDEESVRVLFQKSYESLFEEYPAVRKMVKTALHREFAFQSTEATFGGMESSIAGFYKKNGGCFFVASTISHDESPDARSIVGCVGIRRAEAKIATGSLEIFRLAVDEEHRGKGIGRELLQKAELFAASRRAPNIIASTITKLESAMKTYEACGYQIESDKTIGSLTMRTYSKTI